GAAAELRPAPRRPRGPGGRAGIRHGAPEGESQLVRVSDAGAGECAVHAQRAGAVSRGTEDRDAPFVRWQPGAPAGVPRPGVPHRRRLAPVRSGASRNPLDRLLPRVDRRDAGVRVRQHTRIRAGGGAALRRASDAMTPRPLFILEMANNHMGDVEHGVALVRAMKEAVRGYDQFDFAFKLQFRDLDTYIHPSARHRADQKYIKRFDETRLTREKFETLVAAMRAHGFVVACTPFDEPSVTLLEAMGIDLVKVASASFTDWPLLERIAKLDKPVVASTATATLDEMDAVVSFFLHRDRSLTLMHCVAEYPTPGDQLRLSQIDVLRDR